MYCPLTFIIFSLLMNIDFASILILIGISVIPLFFLFRKIYKKRFKDNNGKVLRWSIISSLLLAPVLAVLFIAVFVAMVVLL